MSLDYRDKVVGHGVRLAAMLFLLYFEEGCAPTPSARFAGVGRLTPDNGQSMRLASDKVRMLYDEILHRSNDRPASRQIRGVMYVGCIGLTENDDMFWGCESPANGGRGDSYCIEAPHDPTNQSNVASIWEYFIGADDEHSFHSQLLLWHGGRWTSGENLLTPEDLANAKALRRRLGFD